MAVPRSSQLARPQISHNPRIPDMSPRLYSTHPTAENVPLRHERHERARKDAPSCIPQRPYPDPFRVSFCIMFTAFAPLFLFGFFRLNTGNWALARLCTSIRHQSQRREWREMAENL